MTDYKNYQSKLIHLTINNPDKYESFVENIKEEYFDEEYLPLARGIFHAHLSDFTLTASAYEDFIEQKVNSGDYKKWTGKNTQPTPTKLGEKRKFVALKDLENVNLDDFDFLLTKVKECYDKNRMEKIISDFASHQSSNFYQAVSELSERSKSVAVSGEKSKFRWLSLDSYGREWMDQFRYKRENREQPLSTGISDIDDAISVGLEPGSLTFFVADTGCFKSAMMLNIALNVFNNTNEKVMFVSLEMNPNLLMQRIIARETGIEMRKLQHPHLATEAEIERVAREIDKWESLQSEFVILDATDGATVRDISEKIKEYSNFHVPRVLVLDYLTILRPEDWYAKLSQHAWYGQMCKDIRTLGRNMGFATISAAQLGRDAIKRLKSQKEGAQTVGSEDVRGSHELAADADSVFVQTPLPSEPREKLQLFCIKSRSGDRTFGGKNTAILNVKPSIGKITGDRDAAWCAELNRQPQQAEINYDVDVDVNANIPDTDPDLDSGDEDLHSSRLIDDSIFSVSEQDEEGSLGDGF